MAIRGFFAAANGYRGFRSSFDKVFNPVLFNKLFVIKGGPGTGKSTLMNKVANTFSNISEVTKIFCSSDTESLDGIIVRKNNITVGLVDGTSPHIVEPIYPGAIEEIVNLGDSFDYEALSKRSEEIIALNNTKKKYYQQAYSLLNIAGSIHEYISDILLDTNVYNKAETLLYDIIKDVDVTRVDAVNDGFLIGAFCKNGYVFIEDANEKKKVEISGDGISQYILMDKIKEALKQHKSILHIYQSPLSLSLIDCIETENCIFTINCGTNPIDSTIILDHTEEYYRLKNLYDSVINESRLSFELASNYHFKLENIYSSSICFEKNSDKYDSIIKKIYSLFSK